MRRIVVVIVVVLLLLATTSGVAGEKVREAEAMAKFQSDLDSLTEFHCFSYDLPLFGKPKKNECCGFFLPLKEKKAALKVLGQDLDALKRAGVTNLPRLKFSRFTNWWLITTEGVKGPYSVMWQKVR